jgi:threonine/homoserine/homoserine lactone efflux protein
LDENNKEANLMNCLRRKDWSPYIGGAIIGILSWIAFLTVAPLGASTSYVRTSGMIEKLFASDHVNSLPYYLKEVPMIDWQWMFVFGVLIGAFISAWLSGTLYKRFVPVMWQERFGGNRWKRWIFAFVGGVILMFGARMADG